MPSGAHRATYAAQFSGIDWAELYEKRDGYLLFEDLKAQWEQAVDPDYVLIDSRTGHTDTGGICTRQLPDAVAIFFFPNEQNLRGLTKVVQDIRAEGEEPRKKEIDLHFVMSNVPDLDDEDRILAGKIDAFRQQLEFRDELTIVHRYDSLSLLNQAVFTKDRPRSRLAEEYRQLVRKIVRGNLADRDGALDYIKRTGARWRRRGVAHESPEKTGLKLHEIEDLHSGDGDVLFALGTFFEHDRQLERAALLFNRAIVSGCEEPEAFLKRGRVRKDNGDSAGATEDALHVLQVDSLPPPLVREAVRLVGDESAENVARSAAVTSLDVDGQVWLANVLAGSLKEVEVGLCILNSLVENEEVPAERREPAKGVLALRCLARGDCVRARKLLGGEEPDTRNMDIQDAFNFAMAAWGETGDRDEGPFQRVVELHGSEEGYDNANYHQCLSVANWAVGQNARALEFVELARVKVEADRGIEFSCWRYYRVPATEFLRDLEEIRALINGDTSRKPRFMTVAPESSAE